MPDTGNRYLKVFELTALIKETLESQFYSVQVEGEVSNMRPSSTGHYYFTLKDSSSMISAVLFKNAAKGLSFIPSDGELVRVTGDVSVYPQRGSYQIICHTVEKAGQGELLAELEKLKNSLAKEGLFDESHKKKLPLMPKRIAVVTSPTGAAIKDILRVLKRRNNRINLVILPAPVQGADAAPLIAAQIRRANMLDIADVLIVGRGGGSLEDLLPFSDEEVVRAIYDSQIPVISAVGHEIDFALSDFAADLRAPTPSAAAEIVSVESGQLEERLSSIAASMASLLKNRLDMLDLRLSGCSSAQLQRTFSKSLNQVSQLVDDCAESMRRLVTEKLKITRLTLNLISSRLAAESPVEILKKGYAAVTDSRDNRVIRSAFDAPAGTGINIRFLDDVMRADVVSAAKLKPAGRTNPEEDIK